jgi:PST family polysaccharide transporter
MWCTTKRSGTVTQPKSDSPTTAVPPHDLLQDVDRGELKRRSVHGAAATIAGQGCRFLAQVGSQVVLARLLTPAQFGLVAMVAPIVGFVQIFNDLGLLEATVQKPTISQRELSGLFWINLAFSAGLALLVVALSPFVAWFYHQSRAQPITAALGTLLICGGLSAQPMALMNRTLRFTHLAMVDIAAASTAATIGIAAAWAGFGSWSLVAMQAGGALATLTLAWSLAGWRPSRPRRVAGLGAMLRFGGHVTAFNVVNSFSYSLPNVFIGARWGAVPLGFYDRGFRLMLLPVMQIVMPFTRIAVPLLSRLQDDPERYRAAYKRVMRTVLLLTTPGIVFAIAFAHPLVTTVLGERCDASADIFAWLGLGALLTPLGVSASWLFISQNRPRQQLLFCCISTTIMVTSFIIGVQWGALGLARTGTLFVWLLQAPMLFWGVTRTGPVRLRDIGQLLYPACLAGAVTFAVLCAARGALAGQTVLLLPLALAAGYVVHATALACLPEGPQALRELWDLRLMFARLGA